MRVAGLESYLLLQCSLSLLLPPHLPPPTQVIAMQSAAAVAMLWIHGGLPIGRGGHHSSYVMLIAYTNYMKGCFLVPSV